MKLNIEVTEKYIRFGQKHSYKMCPIAIAIRHHGFSYVNVNGMGIGAFFDGRWYFAALPLAALNFMRSFDNGSPVQPISFELELFYK